MQWTHVFEMCVCIIVCLFFLGVMNPVSSLPEGVNCDNVKYMFGQKGFATDVPKISGDVRVCGVDHCCTDGMQMQLSYYSRRQFFEAHNQTLAHMSSVLKNKAIKFDDVFKDMLNKSKRDFHDMFTKTYGIIYEQNSYVFTDLFKELEKYYATGQVDLVDAMDDFFNTLYQKMFTVLNAQYTFDDKYLECVNERMKELKPFGDVPSKLSTLLKRSFVATRTFSQALHVAADVVKNMQNMTISESCHTAVAKMSHCPACSGFGELKPCSNYCTNVMKGCLAYHSVLESHWNSFIDVTDKVVDRLLGPFNIEMVVEPIDIKISEAIMIFQENAQQVSQRVFTGCGKPTLGRNKRDTTRSSLETRKSRRATGEIELETFDFSNRGSGGEESNHGSGEEMGKLESVLSETRTALKDTKNFWQKFPYHMCGKGMTANAQDPCWNGKSKDRYVTDVIGDGIVNQQKNPEVTVDVSQPNSLVNEQVFTLKTMNNRLKSAYNGMDVEWIDNEEFYGSGSGSGAGIDESGSGMPPTEITEVPYPSSSEPVPPKAEDNNKEPNEIAPIPDLRHNVSIANTNGNSISGGPKCNIATITFIVPLIVYFLGVSSL
ncbi:glypican-6 [Halyomorpha halys]|uniref:glypican-6 n=1 Tax=Halyomorpha halys TaxID=286706 RepID=UPI0006D4CC01|nr:glypican-6 [Halyomorpha halys]